VKRERQLQPPLERAEIRVTHVHDAKRLRRIAEILQDALDNSGTPEEGHRS
jgi:hypothetical protein